MLEARGLVVRVGNTPSFGAPICPSMGDVHPFAWRERHRKVHPRRASGLHPLEEGAVLRNPRWSVMRKEGAPAVHISLGVLLQSDGGVRDQSVRHHLRVCASAAAWTCPTRRWPSWPSAWIFVTVWTIACFRSPRVSAGKSACSALLPDGPWTREPSCPRRAHGGPRRTWPHRHRRLVAGS